MKLRTLTSPLLLRKGIGRRLAQIGERYGIEQLTYNRFVMLEFHDQGRRNAAHVVKAMHECFPSLQRVLDVGCGTGAFAAEFLHRGIQAVAIEHSSYGRKLARRQGVDCRPFDLRRDPPAIVEDAFDLVYCFEVAEHLPPELGNKLVSFLCSLRAPVVFSAAHPGQGGAGHINEQPKAYWRAIFRSFAFEEDTRAGAALRDLFEENGSAFWFAANVIVFRPEVAPSC